MNCRRQSLIKDLKIIRRILEPLGLSLANARPVPKAHSHLVLPGPFEAIFSQLPALEEEDFSRAPTHGSPLGGEKEGKAPFLKLRSLSRLGGRRPSKKSQAR